MTIVDLTLPITPSLVVWPGDPPVALDQVLSIERGDGCTLTHLRCSAHVGTHVDAPGHFVAGGATVEALALDTLLGPVWVTETTARRIGADTLAPLIPAAVPRVLLRTPNSAAWAAGVTAFDEDYAALTPDGARWLVDAGVQLVGVDGLSVARDDTMAETHRILLGGGVVVLEGLALAGLELGWWELLCLPLKLVGSDGAPARVVVRRG